MEEININHLAVIACAVLNLGLGALWYSPLLFYNSWLKENKLTEEELRKANPAKMYGGAFIGALLISYNLAFFLGDAKTDLVWGATAGFLAGFGFATLIFMIVALFEQRSWKYILINGGYMSVYFTLSGAVIGGWR